MKKKGLSDIFSLKSKL